MSLTLYHGSRTGIVGPIRPDRSRRFCDFGQGFYMGVDIHQPRTLICGNDSPSPTLYTLEFDVSGLRVQQMPAGLDWALFVAYNRNRMTSYAAERFYARYRNLHTQADVIFGKIANDRIFKTVSRFFDGEITAPCLVEALGALNLGDQYCAISRKACAAIKIAEEHVLSAAEVETYRLRAIRQHELAVQRTEAIVRKWRRNTGLFFDEILERMAKEDRDAPVAEDASGEVRS